MYVGCNYDEAKPLPLYMADPMQVFYMADDSNVEVGTDYVIGTLIDDESELPSEATVYTREQLNSLNLAITCDGWDTEMQINHWLG